MSRRRPILDAPPDRLLRISRRSVLGLGGAGLLGLGLPRVGRAASGVPTKFLFVYCRGGWDTTRVFTPMWGTEAEMEGDAEEAETNGISYVSHYERPAVDRFFQTWGDRAAIINGLEVQSVTHQRCRQLIMTGSSDQDSDDWPSQLAAASEVPLVMPHLVLSGPAFTSAHTSRVVRTGSQGQLTSLLDGSATAETDQPIVEPAGADAVDAWLAERVDRYTAARSGELEGHGRAFGGGYLDALDNLALLRQLEDDLDLTPLSRDCSRDIQSDFATAFDCFGLGISRCAMVQYNGWCDQGWDTHQRPELQSWNFEEIFDHLDLMMQTLEGRTGEGGGSLAEEVVVVVLSEMGRHPRVNSWGGKDHWTFTSTMLLGAGVKGGQVVGGLDDAARGRATDLATGQPSDGGALLLPQHLGASLKALGGVEHEASDVISALLA